MFSVIPLFPQNSCPLANALEIQIASFEVVNIILDYGHVNSPIELDKIKIIQKQTLSSRKLSFINLKQNDNLRIPCRCYKNYVFFIISYLFII